MVDDSAKTQSYHFWLYICKLAFNGLGWKLKEFFSVNKTKQNSYKSLYVCMVNIQ